jgi:hypothetical protein
LPNLTDEFVLRSQLLDHRQTRCGFAVQQRCGAVKLESGGYSPSGAIMGLKRRAADDRIALAAVQPLRPYGLRRVCGACWLGPQHTDKVGPETLNQIKAVIDKPSISSNVHSFLLILYLNRLEKPCFLDTSSLCRLSAAALALASGCVCRNRSVAQCVDAPHRAGQQATETT